jgi:hypothetical protein
MNQQLDIYDAIAAGESAMTACTDKAVTLGFSTEAARAFVLKWLGEYGSSWGESIVSAAQASGRADLVAHDTRCWGSVFSTLSRTHRIRCIELGMRAKGHGTAGARKWAAVQ